MSAARAGLEVLEDVDLGFGLHLADGVGRGLVVERSDQPDTVAAAELVDDRRQVRRMKLGETLVRDAKLDAGDRPLDRIDVLPIDVALRNLAVEAPGDGPPRPLDAEPAKQPGRAHVHRDQVKGAFDFVEPQVVDANDFSAVDVHDLAVHQILLEPDLDRAAAGTCVMSIAEVPSVAPLASSETTDFQLRKISRPLVLTTIPVTGG